MTFDLLRQLRERSGLTQDAAAQLAGVSRVTWCEWEAGTRRPTPERVRAAAYAVGASSDELDALLLGAALQPPSRNRNRAEAAAS